MRWVVRTSQFDDARSQRAPVDPRHRDLAGARARRRQGRHAEHAVEGRAVRAAGLPPLLHHALRTAAVEGRVPRLARVARRGARAVAAGVPRRARSHAYDLADDPQVAARVPAPFLRRQPVQALGAAERAQGRVRRQPLAARRLARAVGRQRATCGSPSSKRTFRCPRTTRVEQVRSLPASRRPRTTQPAAGDPTRCAPWRCGAPSPRTARRRDDPRSGRA